MISVAPSGMWIPGAPLPPHDSGTAHFLEGLSLVNDTTSDHYTHFTSDEAQERMHYTMHCLLPEHRLPQPPARQNLPDGKEQLSFAPETSRQRVGWWERSSFSPARRSTCAASTV